MKHKLFAFNVSSEIPVEEIAIIDYSYDAEKQTGVWQGDGLAKADMTPHQTARCTSQSYGAATCGVSYGSQCIFGGPGANGGYTCDYTTEDLNGI